MYLSKKIESLKTDTSTTLMTLLIMVILALAMLTPFANSIICRKYKAMIMFLDNPVTYYSQLLIQYHHDNW